MSYLLGTKGFLNFIFPQEIKGYIEIRAINRGKINQSFYPSVDELLKDFNRFKKLNKRNFNIYIGVCLRDREDGKKEAVKKVTTLWADIDNKKITKEEALERLKTFPIQPSIVVDSGNGVHAYWLLNGSVKASPEIEKIIKGIAKSLGGDFAVSDLSRVMRLPDTMNVKDPSNPKPCKVLSLDSDRRYSINDFSSFEENPRDKTPLKELYKGVIDGERNISLTRLVGSWVCDGLSLEECMENAFLWNSKNNPPEYDKKKIERTVRSIYRKHHSAKNLMEKRKYGWNGNVFEPLLEVEIFRVGKHLIFHNEQILMYKDEWYQPFNDRYYLKLIENQIKYFLDGRRNTAKEILEVLKDNLHKKEQQVNMNPNLINIKNGMFNIEANKLLPHSPEYLSTFQINANYDPNATCPQFEKFLNEVLVCEETLKPDKELIKLIQQFVGYCLFTQIPFHECLMLYGKGRNGKSVLVFTISELFKGLVSQVHFEEIGEDKFATADLDGKLVNVSSEFSTNAKLQDGQIKGIIAGDMLRAQRKYQPAFDFRPIAKHIITTNNLPRSKDKSLGFFSRFKIIPFHRTFLPQEEIDDLQQDDESRRTILPRDHLLEEKLKKEKDGILSWAIEGLIDLLKNRVFCYSKQVQKYKDIFKIRSTSVESFCEKRLEDDCEHKEVLTKVYKEYIDYCRDYGIPFETNKGFATSLRDLGYSVAPGTGNKRFIEGVVLVDLNY